MDNLTIEQLMEKAEAADKIENLDATIKALEARVGELQEKQGKLEEETKEPADTREYETMAYREIKSLRKEIEEIKANTAPKRITREEILSIPDRNKRLKVINENLDLFQQTPIEKDAPANVKSDLKRLGITDESLDNMTLADAQNIKSTATRLYVIEQLLRRA